ncbi:MAG TPA: hypothetical protein VEW67_10300 [Thermoleophilaceae bacterium]|nr:hypothetical protein [Thermoleophilaceae bacterium]
MLRRSSLLVLALVLGLFLAACGDDESDSTTELSESASTTVLPAHHVSAKDGARAHSESDVYECSSMDLEGDAGSAAFGGFQDVSVRGIGCEAGTTRILDVYKTYDDGKVASEVDGYTCSVIEELGSGIATIRCVTSDGKDSFRFTAVPKAKKRVELVAECGTFGRFYDVSVRGQSCQTAATFLDDTPTSQLTKILEGDSSTVGGKSCTTLYVEGQHRTVRCTEGKAALRFSIATTPSTTHPKKYTENVQASSQIVAKKTKDVKPSTNHGLSPNVAISCTATGPFDAITANGINCAAVTALLTQDATQIQAIEPGAKPVKIGTPPTYACQRIDTGNQTDTVECTAKNGVYFRASFIPASSPPPSSGNPPATTTPAAATSGGAATPEATTTTPDDAMSDDSGDSATP